MVRLATLLLSLAASSAAGQVLSHGTAHHTVGHIGIDSAHHAALHALMDGVWSGTFSSPHADSSDMSIAVIHDDTLRSMTLRLTIDPPFVAGPATDLSISALRLTWTQDLSGNSCKGSAVVTPATDLAPETMQGKLACEHGDLVFTLRKKSR